MSNIVEYRDPESGVLLFQITENGSVVGLAEPGEDPGATIDTIWGNAIPEPTADDDGKALVYDHDSGSMAWTAL